MESIVYGKCFLLVAFVEFFIMIRNDVVIDIK